MLATWNRRVSTIWFTSHIMRLMEIHRITVLKMILCINTETILSTFDATTIPTKISFTPTGNWISNAATQKRSDVTFQCSVQSIVKKMAKVTWIDQSVAFDDMNAFDVLIKNTSEYVGYILCVLIHFTDNM